MALTRYFIQHLHWPLMEKIKQNKTRWYIRDMKEMESLSTAQIAETQASRLADLLRHAVATVPAYQPWLAQQEAIGQDPIAFLQQFPILSKADFRQHHQRYLSTALSPATKLIPNRTGGSTGEPIRFYLDRYTVEHYEAARWYGLSWHEIEPGDPSIMVWGSPIELNQRQKRRYLWKERFLKNRLLLPAYELQRAKLDDYLRLLHSFKPAYLYGYASALHLLAELLLQSGRKPGIPLKAVVSTAETLLPHQRERIAEAFQAPVVNEYGARDGGILAYQCPAGGMHIFSQNCLLETVDPVSKQPVGPGQPGLLLVTDLHNYSMPRLRYQLGDIVKLSRDVCSCGRNLPLLEAIEGREDDMFVSTSGQFVHGHYFNHLMRNLDSFLSFQLIQHEPRRLSVKLVKHPEKYKQTEERQFIDGIRQSLGNDVEIALEYVAEIPPSASGKQRYAIRQFPIELSGNGASTPFPPAH